MAKVRVVKRKVKVAKEANTPLWTLERNGVTQSFLHSFLKCREQTRLAYVEGLTSHKPSKPKEQGSCGHWVLSKLYNRPGVARGTDVEVYLKEYHRLWLSLVQRPTQAQLTIQEETYAIIGALLRAYLLRYGGDWNGKYKQRLSTVTPLKWQYLETAFKREYVYPDGLAVPLQGVFDGVFTAKTNPERPWLFETKFKARIDEEGIEDMLPLDLQVMLYLYALSMIYGKQPMGVLYNVIRRPALHQKKGEPLKEYADRVFEDAAARPDHYFIRWDMKITKAEIEAWKVGTLDPLMADVRNWAEGGPHYLNSEALITKYGRCDLYEYIVRGSRSLYYRRASAFNELEETI